MTMTPTKLFLGPSLTSSWSKNLRKTAVASMNAPSNRILIHCRAGDNSKHIVVSSFEQKNIPWTKFNKLAVKKSWETAVA